MIVYDANEMNDTTEDQQTDQIVSNATIYNMLKIVNKKLDHLISLHSDGNRPCTEYDGPGYKPFAFKRLKTKQDLISFEKRLENDDYRNNMLKSFVETFQNMDKYQKSHRRFVYKAIDMFTKRRLFSIYSWTGKARNGQKNMSLEKHTVFSQFIYSAIKRKLPKFKFSELEDIFQSLCRNKNSKTVKESESD